jgi:hypothetical protein
VYLVAFIATHVMLVQVTAGADTGNKIIRAAAGRRKNKAEKTR